MCTLIKIRQGLEILERHLEPDDYQYLNAEHDIIYAGDKPAPDSEDGCKLAELGWLWEEEYGCWSVFV